MAADAAGGFQRIEEQPIQHFLQGHVQRFLQGVDDPDLAELLGIAAGFGQRFVQAVGIQQDAAVVRNLG